MLFDTRMNRHWKAPMTSMGGSAAIVACTALALLGASTVVLAAAFGPDFVVQGYCHDVYRYHRTRRKN